MTKEKKETRLSFFDLMGAINKKTKLVWDDEIEATYNSFMINRGFSGFSDCVLYANEMNCFPDLDKKMQYDFYFGALKKGNRFGGWDKASKRSEDEMLVSEYYDLSKDKTDCYIELLDLVNPDWRKHIREKLERGGKQ